MKNKKEEKMSSDIVTGTPAGGLMSFDEFDHFLTTFCREMAPSFRLEFSVCESGKRFSESRL